MRKLIETVSKYKEFYKKQISDDTIFNSIHLLLYIKSISKTLKNVYAFPGLDDYVTINIILKNKVLIYQIFKDKLTIDFNNELYLENQNIEDCKSFFSGIYREPSNARTKT